MSFSIDEAYLDVAKILIPMRGNELQSTIGKQQ